MRSDKSRERVLAQIVTTEQELLRWERARLSDAAAASPAWRRQCVEQCDHLKSRLSALRAGLQLRRRQGELEL